MGVTNQICYQVARNIIEDIFIINYIPTIIEGKTWCANLNDFLEKEWMRLKTVEDEIEQFTENEEHVIISDAMQILLDNMKINEDEWEKHEDDVSWDRFDDVIRHYIYQYKPKIYGTDRKELKNEFQPAAGGG
jgi:hypothetical protein